MPVSAGRVFFVLTMLLVSGIVLAADAAAAAVGYRQLRAASFPTVEGVVTRSEVTTRRDGDETWRRLEVAYDYEVGGRRYTGTRYCFAEIGTPARTWPRIRDELPVGARVPVAYDPSEPAESLLRPGLIGFHLAAVWFLTPFNLLVFFIWSDLARGRQAFDAADPRVVAPTATGWRVRLPGAGRADRFAGVLMGITVLGSFVWAVAFDFNPPVSAAAAGFLVALAAASAAAARHTPRWLEVDELARVLRLAARPEAVEVPFGAIRDVIVTRGEREDDGGAACLHHCELVRCDAAPEEGPTRVATYGAEWEADAFADWLRERIGVARPAPSAEPGAAPA